MTFLFNIYCTENLISLNLFKNFWIVTWAWIFLTSQGMEAVSVRGQKHYCEHTLWHYNSTFSSCHSAISPTMEPRPKVWISSTYYLLALLTLLSIFSLSFQITFSVILRIQVALSVVFVLYMPQIMILAAGNTRQLTTTSGACLQNRKWVNFRKLKVLIRAVVGVHMTSKMMSKKLVKSRLNSTIWLVCRSIFSRSCFLRLIWTKNTLKCF